MPKAPAQKAAVVIPDWVTKTPDGPSYLLVMFSDNGDAAQEINITRAEFLGLKKRLASMRGGHE